MLLYNVMSGFSYAARFNIALGQRSRMRVGSEQSLSVKRGEDVSLNTPIWLRGSNLIQLKLSVRRVVGAKKKGNERLNPGGNGVS